MTSKKQRILKKLRKKHIWPSVLGFLCFGVITFFIVLLNASTMLMLMLLGQYADDLDRANALAAACAEEYQKTDSWDLATERISLGGDFVDSVAVVDAEGNYCSGFGERTYDTENVYNDTFSQSFGESGKYPDVKLLLDNTPGEVSIGNPGDEQLSIDSVIGEAFSHVMFSFDVDSISEIYAFRCRYWIGFPIGDTGKQLLVRDDLYLLPRDVLLVDALCIIICALMMIPSIVLLAYVIRDVVSARRLRKLIYTDPVTGGHNFLYLEHHSRIIGKLRPRNHGKAAAENVSAKKLENRPAVVIFTLRKYRSYCSCHGVAEGEALLERIDALLKSHLRKREMSAHYSEAEFVLVLIGKTPEEIQQRVHDITAKVMSALEHSHLVFHSGIYFADGGESDIASDVAQMCNYAASAKNSIRDCEISAYAMFNKELLDQQLWEHHVEACMDEALAKEEFQVYLQPKYDPISGSLRGAEALIRWISPTDGFVSPGRFIPIFERNGFITRIDDYMISHVAAQQAKWIAEGKQVVPVSVNVSRAHFTQADLAEHIRDLVDEYGIPHSVIEIELTESAFFDDKGALLSTVNKLKSYGFEISMDDFGAGYSSLNSLKDLPLDVLKLDAEFFRGNNSDNRGEVVVSEAIKLAKNLDMRIVAEGVEKKEQVDFLAANGCDMIQGFYFAKPMPIADFEQKHYTAKEQA